MRSNNPLKTRAGRSFNKKVLVAASLCLLVVAGMFVLFGCETLNEIYAPNSYSLDDLKFDIYEARAEHLNGYKGYSGKVIKISPLVGSRWNDYSRALYWEWEQGGSGFHQITVNISILVESPESDAPVISAYKPASRGSNSPTSIRWSGPGNVGWTVENGDEYYGQFGGKAAEIPRGKWVDLRFSQAIDTTYSPTGQVFLNGHSDTQGLYDLTVYIRDFRVTMESTTKFVALTFNEGPTDFTHFLLDRLDNLDLQASFFLMGMSIDAAHPIYDRNLSGIYKENALQDRREAVRRIMDDHHDIGNYSYSHNSTIEYPLNEAGIRRELENAQLAIQKAIYGDTDYANHPQVSKFTRIPYDNDPARVINPGRAAAGLGLPIIRGLEHDNSSSSAEEIAEYLFQRITPWSIVSFQDSRVDPTVLRVLDILVPRLRSEGYVFVTLSEMVERRGRNLTPGAVYNSMLLADMP